MKRIHKIRRAMRRFGFAGLALIMLSVPVSFALRGVNEAGRKSNDRPTTSVSVGGVDLSANLEDTGVEAVDDTSVGVSADESGVNVETTGPESVSVDMTNCTPGGATAAALNTANLTKFRTAQAQSSTKPVNVLYTGDSLTEGYGASNDANRFQNLLTKRMQAAYNPPNTPGGEGFIPFWHQTYWPFQRWVMGNLDSGGASPVHYNNPGFGLGQRGGVLVGNQYGYLVVNGDRIWIMFTQSTAVTNLGISVDFGPYQNVWTNAADAKSGRIWDSGPLFRGNHFVAVKAQPHNGQPGLAVADGIMVFDGDGGATPTTGKGVRGWDNGFSGASVPTFTNANSQYAHSAIENVDPHLILIGLGTNDSRYYDANTYKTYLTDLINKYRNGSGSTPAAANASIMLWVEPQRSDVDPTLWQNYVNAMYEVASTQGTGIVDMNSRMGKAVVGDFFIDSIHLTDGGNRMVADGIAQALGAVQCAPISGTITDGNTSAPLAGMCVTAIDVADNKPVSYARTASDGTYTIWTPPGTYNLKNWDCAGTGYTTSNHSGSVPGGTSGITDTMFHP